MLRDFSLRDFGASLNTVESYTNESSQGKIGLCETVNKQKCTHLGMFLASEDYIRCQKCGTLVKNYRNTNKYCKTCGQYQPIETKIITCVDCGKEIEINSSSRKIRCNDCYRLERQEHNRKMYRNRSTI